jgi:hypothetical protein
MSAVTRLKSERCQSPVLGARAAAMMTLWCRRTYTFAASQVIGQPASQNCPINNREWLLKEGTM